MKAIITVELLDDRVRFTSSRGHVLEFAPCNSKDPSSLPMLFNVVRNNVDFAPFILSEHKRPEQFMEVGRILNLNPDPVSQYERRQG